MTALPFFFSFPVSPLPIRATSPAVRKHQRISRRKCAEELDSENITLDADALRSHVRLWLRTLTTLVQGHTGSPTPTLHKWLKKEYPITEKAPSSCKPACPFSLSVELNIVGQSPTVLEIRPVHVMGDARRDRTPYVCSPDVMRYSAGSVVPSLCRHLPLVSVSATRLHRWAHSRPDPSSIRVYLRDEILDACLIFYLDLRIVSTFEGWKTRPDARRVQFACLWRYDDAISRHA